ncbi:MAG: hypothetical protein E6G39_06720, partial [Actinobacteria bacterium]
MPCCESSDMTTARSPRCTNTTCCEPTTTSGGEVWVDVSGELITEVADGIGWIIFDNQEKRNAINRAMLAELPRVLASYAVDDAVRVVVLRGAGQRSFTAGADISELGDQPMRVSVGAHDEGFGVRELREFPKPVVAMIYGFCMGGGVVMAMGADMRIGSDDSVYCIP